VSLSTSTMRSTPLTVIVLAIAASILFPDYCVRLVQRLR
jgi:hypothetical protein